MPDLFDIIAAHEAAQAERPAGHAIRVRRAVVMNADDWQFNLRKLRPLSNGPHARFSERRAFTGFADQAAALGVPVGYVVEERLEVVP